MNDEGTTTATPTRDIARAAYFEGSNLISCWNYMENKHPNPQQLVQPNEMKQTIRKLQARLKA